MNVVVTGASGGLGKEIATQFRIRGHAVIGTSHMYTALQQDDRLMYFEVGENDTGTDPAIFASAAMARMEGQLDVLINNAGMNAISPFEELTPRFLKKIMKLNFETPVFLVQAFLRHFNCPGLVINIISDAAWRPMRHSLAYNCSKAALDMATKQMARELTKPYDLSIIGIRPGKMAGTGMSRVIDQRVQEVRGWTPEQAADYFKQNSVSGLELNPEDVAKLIADLATGGMVRQLSGTCIDLVG